MFIRVKSNPTSPRKSVQICENIRIKDKVKQKIVHHVGIAFDDAEIEKLKAYANELIPKILLERAKQSTQTDVFGFSEQDFSTRPLKGRPKQKRIEDILPPSQVTLDDVVEGSRLVEGVHDIAGAMFDELYGALFKNQRKLNCLKDIILLRLVVPCSKHAAQKKLQTHFDKHHSLDSIYRMMDELVPTIDRVKQLTFEKTKSLFPDKVDMIFFDVTTLYFESTDVDELRNFGYSKDHRFNTTQVVLALATNQDGLPIAYELFEGNRAEVTTLLVAVQSWKKLFMINSVCFIGDRGMFTHKNIELLKAHQCDYIIAAKLRKMPQAVQQTLFDEQHYRPTVMNNTLAWIGEFDYHDERLIVSYKTQRAVKDAKERQSLLTKIEKSLGRKGNPNRLITNAGVKKFVTKDENASITLDADKINHDAQWDGLHGIVTNLKDATPESLLARYARLWVIEESFRINKHNLQMRPIYHFKPERIHSHIAICYMTFAVLRHLQYRINLTQKVSINDILDELLNVQSSIHIHKKTKDRYRLPGFLSHTARKIYKSFGKERSLDAEVYL